MTSDAGLSLGSVDLSGFELPEQVLFGGTQRVAVHRFPGGGQITDILGPDERDIAWSGMMIGPDAALRAGRLDHMRQSGNAVMLVFGSIARMVLVTQFEAAYRRISWIGHYTIRCMVLSSYNADMDQDDISVAADLAAAVLFDPATMVTGGIDQAVADTATRQSAFEATVQNAVLDSADHITQFATACEGLARAGCAQALLGHAALLTDNGDI